MLDAFYGAFSPACFALLGLWLVVVQTRLREWQASPAHRRGSYGVALHFALPGVMSVLALIDTATPAFWRVSFAIVALGGAVVVATTGGLTVRDRGRQGGLAGGGGVAAGLALAAYVTSVLLYAGVGALAFAGGTTAQRAAAVLLTALVFVGFNAAWLLLIEDVPHSRPRAMDQRTGG